MRKTQLTHVLELCNNMCWGAYCTDQGDGPIGVTLTYDAPDDNTKDARYKKACQTPNNRCSGNGDYNSCDEYPFKVTSDADIEDAVSRCVTQNAQSSRCPPFLLLVLLLVLFQTDFPTGTVECKHKHSD